ncbi:atrophin-1-like [Scylla paramamosain]|uniref:atrophin-1-like n=1 Tax=Scylla paramamosain TaxID=85552 RepID=UPI003082B0A7
MLASLLAPTFMAMGEADVEHAAASSLPGKARNMPLTPSKFLPLIEDSEESLSTLPDDSRRQKEQENYLFDTFPAPLSLAPSHFPKNFSHPSLPHNVLLGTWNLHWERHPTDTLQYTTPGRIRQDTTPPVDPLPQLCPRHCRHQTQNRTLPPQCPHTQARPSRHPSLPGTPAHLLLHCSRHHFHRTALLHSLASLHIDRPPLPHLLSGSKDPGLAFNTLQHTRVFLQKTGQLTRI